MSDVIESRRDERPADDRAADPRAADLSAAVAAPSSRRHASWVWWVLALMVLLPHAPMLLGLALPLSDDLFASDLLDGEFPGRVEAARIWRNGEPPTWTPRVLTGTPLVVDTPSLVLFSILPPAAALGWNLGLYVLIAALGTFVLARGYGAHPFAAALAGFAYAWSGFFVCQMRHVSVIAAAALLPVALFCLEQAYAAMCCDGADSNESPKQRMARALPWLVGFAGVAGGLLHVGFPQTAYAAFLVLGAVTLARVIALLRASPAARGTSRRITPALGFAAAVAVATALALGLGASTLLPMAEVAGHSDRASSLSYEVASSPVYWLPNLLTFVVPYANGDITDLSYQGRNLFWEDYGYVGVIVMIAAVVGAVAPGRRLASTTWLVAGVVAMLLVLGRHTPVHGWAFEWVPGFSRFRMPGRFLFIVELALVVLASLGLTFLHERLVRWVRARDAASGSAPVWTDGALLLVVILGAVDVYVANHRQNAWVDASDWLRPPASVETVVSGGGGRVYTPGVRKQHEAMLYAAGGWSGDLEPFITFRGRLQPNTNLLHGVHTFDGYTGVAPSHVIDLLGDHNRKGLMNSLFTQQASGGFDFHPAFFDWIEASSVRWLVLPTAVEHPRLQVAAKTGDVVVHHVPGALPRARLLGRARLVDTRERVALLTLQGGFRPRDELLLHEIPAADQGASLLEGDAVSGAAGEARIVEEHATSLVFDVDATRDAFLVIADSFDPGWVATVDDAPVPVLRANLAHRAVFVPTGRHRVKLVFAPASLDLATALSGSALALLLLAGWFVWRRRG
jgi:hypothetical protein